MKDCKTRTHRIQFSISRVEKTLNSRKACVNCICSQNDLGHSKIEITQVSMFSAVV